MFPLKMLVKKIIEVIYVKKLVLVQLFLFYLYLLFILLFIFILLLLFLYSCRNVI